MKLRLAFKVLLVLIAIMSIAFVLPALGPLAYGITACAGGIVAAVVVALQIEEHETLVMKLLAPPLVGGVIGLFWPAAFVGTIVWLTATDGGKASAA